VDDIMQGLRQQNIDLCMYVAVKVGHEPVDLKFLSVKVCSILEKLHKMGLILENHTTTLS
jgi:hypothetical protein